MQMEKQKGENLETSVPSPKPYFTRLYVVCGATEVPVTDKYDIILELS